MLLSGGLDSTIVLGLLKQQGIDVEAIHFTSLFCTCGGKDGGCGTAMKAAKNLDVNLNVVGKGEDYIELIKRDNIKQEYCLLHNINLIKIPYWEFDNIEKILIKEITL